MRYTLIIFLLTLLPIQALAAAWTLEKGQRQTIHTLYIYHANKYFDADSKLTSQTNFTKFDYNIYSEEGLTDTLTFGTINSGQVLLQEQEVTFDLPNNEKFTYSYLQNAGVTELELFLRQQVMEKNNYVFSIQPLIKLPSYIVEESNSDFNNSQLATELKFLGGYSFDKHYVHSEIGIRHFFDTDSPSLSFDIGAGIKLNKYWTFIPSLSSTFYNRALLLDSFTDQKNIKYDLVKLQLTTLYEMSDQYALQFGAYKDIYGKETGAGNSFIIALWKRF